MALVRCAKCEAVVSNKTYRCLHCGYEPIGICENCKWYEEIPSAYHRGYCLAANRQIIFGVKALCPAGIKKDD